MMLNLKSLIYIVFLSFVVFGCNSSKGDPLNSSNTQLNINDGTQNSNDINITKATETIKKSIGVGSFKPYISKDKKNIFVVNGGKLIGDKLLNYDITKKEPELRNTIVEWTDAHIIDVKPLSNGKLIYQRYPPVNLAYIHIYDYILEKEISTYSIEYINSEKLDVSSDEMSFTIENLKIDISDIYIDIAPSKKNIYRDDTKRVVIDPINNLIWQDDEDVQNNIYSLEEAISVCQTKSKYKWRLPTFKNIHMLMTQQPEPFKYPLFLYPATGSSLVQANVSFDDGVGYYTIDNDYGKYSRYLTFNFGKTNSWQGHVRCVTDLDEKLQQTNEKFVAEAIDKIKAQSGSDLDAVYVAKDKKNIFVVNGRKSSGYELLDYDITKKWPMVKNTIVEWTYEPIIEVKPLSDGKLIYQKYLSVNLTGIYIYDYILEKEISSYMIEYANSDELYVSSDEKFFMIEDLKIGISDFYTKLPLSQHQIYRDEVDDIVVDSVNNLIWQDDMYVTEDTYSYIDAQNLCNAKSNYKWRLPTVKDINLLLSQQSKPFISLFKYRATGNYHLQTPISSYNGFYHINLYSQYERFLFKQTAYKSYVRCVADNNMD